MGEVLTALRENGDVIAEAPLVAVLWALVIGALMFAAVRSLKAHQIGDLKSRLEHMESRLSLRSDEIADYKRKLEGASPEEAQSRIANLEQTISALLPQEFSGDQLTALSEGLKGTGGDIHIVYDGAYSDGQRKAMQLAAVMQGAGWTVMSGVLVGPSFQPPQGLSIAVTDPNEQPKEEAVLLSALRAAGIPFAVRGRRGDAPIQLQFTRPHS